MSSAITLSVTEETKHGVGISFPWSQAAAMTDVHLEEESSLCHSALMVSN